MPSKVNRVTVDVSPYPDLVVIYLGMPVNSLRGLNTLMQFGRRIKEAVAQKPDGLLLHENLMFSLLPPHAGMRQYWRDFASLETWSRSLPHQGWWQTFLRDPAGTGFWHETYFMRGGMEAIYGDVPLPLGFLRFAPSNTARGPMFSARHRLGIGGEAPLKPGIAEEDL
jgi:hypothetical protein